MTLARVLRALWALVTLPVRAWRIEPLPETMRLVDKGNGEMTLYVEEDMDLNDLRIEVSTVCGAMGARAYRLDGGETIRAYEKEHYQKMQAAPLGSVLASYHEYMSQLAALSELMYLLVREGYSQADCGRWFDQWCDEHPAPKLQEATVWRYEDGEPAMVELRKAEPENLAPFETWAGSAKIQAKLAALTTEEV